jgi:hypothetical protein
VTNQLNRVRVAFLVANEGIEEVELTEPWTAIVDAGGSPQPTAQTPARALVRSDVTRQCAPGHTHP